MNAQKLSKIKIALAQINPTVGDLPGNQKIILNYIERAKAQKADIVVFPEMAICGYPPEDLLFKKHFIKDNIATLKAIARKIKKITAVIGFVDTDKEENLYNAAAVIADGKVVGVYHKEQLPNYGVFDEKRYFTKGKDNKSFTVNTAAFGVNICEDIWHTQGTYKKQTQQGIRLLINLSSSPFDSGKFKQREQLLKTRAKETKAYICYVNLVGGQDELVFDGGSIVVDPQGNIVASGKQFEEDLVVAELDLKSTTPKQLVAAKFNQIEQIYRALVLGTKDYVVKNNFEKVVIGLSGGIDSALVAAIAVDAVGKDNVVLVTMPSRYTSKATRTDAEILAGNLGAEFKVISIEEPFKAYDEALKGVFAGTKAGITEENIQARIRGNFLMAMSNKFGYLVLTTGNKSEIAVGYCTLYGDMSGGFAVIKDVLKTQVYALSRFVNSQGREIIPKSIINRAPSAELRNNQKDQDSLPEYEVLDAMLKEYVEEYKSAKIMSKKNNIDLIKKIIGLVDRNEYKRRQGPPGIKITSRAFGRDRRLPITNKYSEFRSNGKSK